MNESVKEHYESMAIEILDDMTQDERWMNYEQFTNHPPELDEATKEIHDIFMNVLDYYILGRSGAT